MKPHQQRVMDERFELDIKREKLQSFIGSIVYLALPESEKDRLLRQSVIMDDYSKVLFERIAAFEPQVS